MSTFGFIAPEDIWSARSEQYFNQVLAGIEDAVAGAGHTVLTRAVASREEEMAAYRDWAARGTVAAVVLRDLVPEDPRPALLAELGLGHVLEGDVVQDGEAPSVTVDNAAVMRGVLDALRSRGLERIAHLGGPQGLVHSALRRGAYLDWCDAAGETPRTAEGDYTGDSGARALDALLTAADDGPDVLLADNDAMALGALERARLRGIAVPGTLSIVSWDDSMACQLHEPPLAALGAAPRATGAAVGRALSALVEQPPRVLHERRPQPVLLDRGTLRG